MISMKNVWRRTTSFIVLLGHRVTPKIRYALEPPHWVVNINDPMPMNTKPRRTIILRATQKPFWRLR